MRPRLGNSFRRTAGTTREKLAFERYSALICSRNKIGLREVGRGAYAASFGATRRADPAELGGQESKIKGRKTREMESLRMSFVFHEKARDFLFGRQVEL